MDFKKRVHEVWEGSRGVGKNEQVHQHTYSCMRFSNVNLQNVIFKLKKKDQMGTLMSQAPSSG